MLSPSKAHMRWAASILAAVINSVVICLLASPQPTVPFHASTQIEDRVLDLPTKKLIRHARLMLRAANYAGCLLADLLGRYGFDITLSEAVQASFVIEAEGNPRYSADGTVEKLVDVGDDELLHEVAAGESTFSGNSPAASTNPTQAQSGERALVLGGDKAGAIGAPVAV